jgi:hypothetical protein
MTDDGLVSGRQLYEVAKPKREPNPKRELPIALSPIPMVFPRKELKAQLRIVHGGKAKAV